VLGLCTILAFLFLPQIVNAQSPTANFTVPELGGVAVSTSGASTGVNTGYAQIATSGAVPAGVAIFGLRQNNVLVSEAPVPEAPVVTQGQIYVEIGGGVDTGLAIANPNNQPVDIAFYFTDASGARSGQNTLTLPANGQMAAFLDQAPFNAGSAFLGTMTFIVLRSSSTVGVSAIALRLFTNERNETLMTTLPVTPLGSPALFAGDVLPHFASGGGWTTQIVLTNPEDSVLAGSVTFTDPSGQPVSVATELGTASSFSYRVQPGSAWRLRTSNTGSAKTGSVRITSGAPGSDIPIGYLIYSYQNGAVRVMETGVPPARPTTTARLFVDEQGKPGTAGSLETGIAISNADATVPTHVTFDLTALNGTPSPLHGAIDLPPGGQLATFVHQIFGLETLPIPFQGVMRIASSNPVSITGLRGRINERGDFLSATIPPVNQDDAYYRLQLRYGSFLFPHFADGGGFTTEFIMFSGWTPGPSNGTLSFFTSAGAALPVTLN
jgi:hypothetical protein